MTGSERSWPSSIVEVDASKVACTQSMLTRTCCQASWFLMATVPVPLAPGPGMVPLQPRPSQVGQARQKGPMFPRAAAASS